MGLKSSKICESDLMNKIEIPDNDRKLLKTLGFDIEEMIGFGEFGSVYRGAYKGISAGGLKDYEDNLLDLSLNQEFAVKYINVKGLEELELSKGGIDRFDRVRRFVESEKKFRNEVIDSTVLPLRFCVNLGDFQPICLNANSILGTKLEELSIRPSYDRIYLFMDWAKLGNLDQYLERLTSNGQKVRQNEAILWMRTLLSAVKYLQDTDVYKLNLKANNILMVEDVVDGERVVVPKLTDFLAYDYFYEDWDKIDPDEDELQEIGSSDEEEEVEDEDSIEPEPKKAKEPSVEESIKAKEETVWTMTNSERYKKHSDDNEPENSNVKLQENMEAEEEALSTMTQSESYEVFSDYTEPETCHVWRQQMMEEETSWTMDESESYEEDWGDNEPENPNVRPQKSVETEEEDVWTMTDSESYKEDSIGNEPENSDETVQKIIEDFVDQQQQSSGSSDDSCTQEDESDSSSGGESYKSINSSVLLKRSEIFHLAFIFETIVAKTQFDSESVRLLATDLIESMKDYSVEDCDTLLSNQLFNI